LQSKYVELFKNSPQCSGCHAGLASVGLLGQNYPDVDMIKFWTTFKGPFSLMSAPVLRHAKILKFILKILEEIPKK